MLSTWWPDYSHDLSCHNSENWLQRNGNKLTLKLKINYLKQSRWCLSDHWWLISRWPSELTGLSACCPLPQPIKAIAHWLGVMGGWRVSFLDNCLHSSLVAGIQNKVNFPFHQPCLFIGFRAMSSQLDPTFNYNFSPADLEQSKTHLYKEVWGIFGNAIWQKSNTWGKSC